MKSKHKIPAFITAGVLGASIWLPAVYAETSTATVIEQKSDQAQGAIKDAWLDGKLETAILFNEHLNSFDIDTEVRNRTAYLSGAVESDIDRELAEHIAKSVDGITQVKNELVVDKSKANLVHTEEGYVENHSFRQAVLNATLTARIKSQLLVSDNTEGLSIDVDSSDGVVTLSGKVRSAEEKELAAKIAETTAGTQSVDNRLVVSAN
jgi:osmotically-inducible protein OsmY